MKGYNFYIVQLLILRIKPLVIKGTVAPVRVWLKVVWLERAKVGKEAALCLFLLFPAIPLLARLKLEH